MISTEETEAHALVDEAVEEHGIKSIYGLFSGGHDSLTSTALVANHSLFAGVVHINTGIGIEETRTFVRDICHERSWDLNEVRAPEGKYEELVLTRGGFPGGPKSHNSMLFYLKQQPLAKWFKTVEGRAGFITGIRKQESIRRMGAGISVPIRRDGRKVWISPILEWSKIDCGRFLAAQTYPRNRVVDVLHRSGECLCGALAKKDEIREIDRWFPVEAERIHTLERQCRDLGLSYVWAARKPRKRVHPDQEQLPGLFPLCTSCQAEGAED